MSIRFNIKGYIDRRTADLHARYDAICEQRWRWRVARNPKEIARRKAQ